MLREGGRGGKSSEEKEVMREKREGREKKKYHSVKHIVIKRLKQKRENMNSKIKKILENIGVKAK